jgi:hypothetical protein
MIGWPQVLMQLAAMYIGTKMAILAEAADEDDDLHEEFEKLGIFARKITEACEAEDLYEVSCLIAKAGE